MSANTELPAGLEECVRRKVRLSFARSGGRGGQNVNKVSTKVLARIAVGSLDVLTEEQRERLKSKLAGRITEGEVLAVFVDEERSQARNRELAILKLVELIARAIHRPLPRIKTRPPRSANRIRLEGKKIQGRRKRQRRTPELD